ncbi:UDPglucose--hexose-1-phosphate uridylyltransferase [Haloactinospora alba]|uniref:Galactose-1-phosphate uridylyltransferase n=1 Tax=Haloactinospora alba TaxID=405555 RepID=A0A543N9D3_9ACTN|nr:galactose-1-phosphate uridylyltransferase [Haloactinospora alba]TQN28409.1 UDPglucose--hexose-1-phosphate uridylyltransferase [Haloactinospora alba]
MRKTPARLADGREIIYFDESGSPHRELRDPRPSAPPPTASELRFDPLTEEWVVMAAHRQGRTHLPASDACPLCPSTAERHTEIPASSYDVVTFENRFPALSYGEAPPGGADDLPVPRATGEGRCEVLCFADEHDASFVDLSPDRVRTIVDVWADRTRELSELPGVRQVFCFENRGAEIGVTLHHPHGQIYAYPFLTPRTRRTLDAARRYQERTGNNLFADTLRAEQHAGTRIVRRTEYWTAFVPSAARWPVELQVYPNRRVGDLPELTEEECDDLSVLYLDLLGRMDRLFGQPLPYVAAWHQAPVRSRRDLAYLHLELFSVRRAPDKLKYLAGSEAAMGVFVNDVLPETTAQRLREAAQ